ncbi:MAG: hypothetical protein ACRDWT_07130 [Jatrophihabitantaceae bacterium]
MSEGSDDTYANDWLGGWEAVGIPSAEIEAWARAGYRPTEASQWRGAGALDPGTAAQWERFGFTPSTAQSWMAIGEVGPADAITMSDAGMTPAVCARIRAADPRCATVAADDSAQPRVEEQSQAIGF